MYIKRKFTIFHILGRAWKNQLLILIVIIASTIFYQEFFKGYLEVSRTIISVLGTAIAFFIAFINAQSYDRWWEARQIWGNLTNDSWSLSRMTGSFLEDDSLKNDFIYRHLAFLYALIDKLRGQNNRDYVRYLKEDELKAIEKKSNIPAAILNLQGRAINKAQKENKLELFRMIQFNKIFNRFSDSMGQAFRIKTTVFPPYYKSLILFSIWVFIIIYPMVLSERVGYWSILYSYILGSIFSLFYTAGQSLMDPFERKISDTPISTITRNIEIDLLEQLGKKEIPEALKPIDGTYYL